MRSVTGEAMFFGTRELYITGEELLKLGFYGPAQDVP
jgi:hypothetical protein